MFNVGDKVKVIPESYIDILRHDFRQIMKFKMAFPEAEDLVMLGGTYSVLSTQQQPNGNFYKLLSHAAPTHQDFLELADNVMLCPYNVGDEVIFQPQCSAMELASLQEILHASRLDKPDIMHRITYVLNEYYIFVDFEFESPWAFPFRWTDFVKRE